MSADAVKRRCGKCSSYLAADNLDDLCRPCQRTLTIALSNPPEVPREFWNHPQLRDALVRQRHIGRAIWCYRNHPHHGLSPISQSVAAHWLNISQSQLARIEKGRRIDDLGRLSQWARILRIPRDFLWFNLIDEPASVKADHDTSSESDPASIPGEDAQVFGALLTDLMEKRGVGVRELARLIHCNSGYISRIRGGHKYPSPLIVQLLDSALKANGILIAATPTRTKRHSGREKTLSENSQLVEQLRRTLLAGGLAALALPALKVEDLQRIAAAVMNAERYTDAEVVGYCTQQLEACAVQDGLSGPKSALPATLGLIATIERLASGASAQIRGELLKVGARAAEFCGWLYRDAGAAEIASYWRDRAVELAQMSGDYAMQGYVLLKKSQAVWDERDGLRMLTLAEAVQQGPWKLPVRVQAEAVQQQARGVALLGGSLALIESKLAEAHEMLTQGLTLSADQSRGDASHYTNALFGIQAAICYCEAGQLETSLELYENWLSPGTFSRRDYAYFLALKGGVLARMEHAEDAAEIGLEAFTLARETESVRTVKELARMASRLGGYADRAGVHELRMLVLTS